MIPPYRDLFVSSAEVGCHVSCERMWVIRKSTSGYTSHFQTPRYIKKALPMSREMWPRSKPLSDYQIESATVKQFISHDRSLMWLWVQPHVLVSQPATWNSICYWLSKETRVSGMDVKKRTNAICERHGEEEMCQNFMLTMKSAANENTSIPRAHRCWH